MTASNAIQEKMIESINVKKLLINDSKAQSLIEEMISSSVRALKNGNKIIFAGNGGSFADSIHLAAEFISRFKIDRHPLASLALGCNNSTLTATGNDYSYDDVFYREIYALGQAGDVFFAISTSGNSKNILKAVAVAKERKINVFGWSGQSGGQLAAECKTLCIPSQDTARIQECHIMVGHIICEIVEAKVLSPDSRPTAEHLTALGVSRHL